jgi:hypothetical protein
VNDATWKADHSCEHEPRTVAQLAKRWDCVAGITAKEKLILILDTMSQYAVLYPRGGAFNKLRAEQSFLENLLKDSLEGYCELTNSRCVKKNYVKNHIFDALDASGHVFMVFEGEDPTRGKLVQPCESDAYKRIMQKFRSMKKEKWMPLGSAERAERKVTGEEHGEEECTYQEIR